MPRNFVRVLVSALLLAALASTQDSSSAEPKAEPKVTLRGRVADTEGRPIAGAAIGYRAAKTTVSADLLAAPDATTDGDGRFELVVTPPQPGQGEARLLHVVTKGKASVAIHVPFQRVDAAAQGAALSQHAEDQEEEEGETAEKPDERPAAPQPKPVDYAPVTDLKQIVLIDGQRLFGRVRDVDGKPLAGARIIARDVFEQGRRFRSGTQHGFFCSADSDRSGIFSLPCALPQGARLDCTLDGHYSVRLWPVAAGTPLEITLERSGFVGGRVLDKDGRSVAGAQVAIRYEFGDEQSSAVTAEDGSFRATLTSRGRWRATATRNQKAGQPAASGQTDVLSGPRDNLEIVVETTAATDKAQAEFVTVTAVDKKTRAAITRFRAGAVWEDYANRNNNYLEYRFRWTLRDATPARKGVATVPGPGKNGTRVGAVRVLAKGYAPATQKDVECQELEPGKDRQPITIELVPEATVAGVVRDETSGAPIAGARVWAEPRQDPNQGIYNDGRSGPPAEAVTTAEDGSYRLTGLGEGSWQVRVFDKRRPPVPAEDIDLAEAEQRTGFDLKLPLGATVGGRITGMPVIDGMRVFLHELPRQNFGDNNSYYTRYYGSQPASADQVEVQPDGSFQIDGVKLQSFLLVLVLPAPPRMGGSLYMPIEPFRVRKDGIQREFDCREDQPGRIGGKIAFQSATVPLERLVVVARAVSEEQQQFFSPFDTELRGMRCFVAPSGEFGLRVGPGTYRLDVVDLATGVRLGGSDKNLRVEANGTASTELPLQLKQITLKLEPEADVKQMAIVDRIELRLLPKANKQGFGGNDHYDTGIGVELPFGALEATVVLPEGDLTCLARNNVTAIRIDDQRWNQPPVGRGELEIAFTAEAKNECVVKIGPPPEIPDPKLEKKEGDTDADGEGKAKAP